MSATVFTEKQLQVRKDTLEAVVTKEHVQRTWFESGAAIERIEQEYGDSQIKPGRVAEISCGTAACAAGHAVLSQATGSRAVQSEWGTWTIELRTKEGRWLDTYSFKNRVAGNPHWDYAGAELLGLDPFEASYLFDGDNSHAQVVYSLQRLVDGKEILAVDDDGEEGLIEPPRNFQLPANDINKEN